MTALLAVPGVAAAAPELNGRLLHKGDGRPIAGAEVMIVGQTGSVKTDADGRFTWNPQPSTPFEVLVVLPGGRVTRPTMVTKHDWSAVLTIEIEAVLNEEVTVTAGVAPSIDAAAGAGMTMLSARDIALRLPANLNQALEGVQGVNQVSEGQAAVPAIRGLADDRLRIKVDGIDTIASCPNHMNPALSYIDPAALGELKVFAPPTSAGPCSPGRASR